MVTFIRQLHLLDHFSSFGPSLPYLWWQLSWVKRRCSASRLFIEVSYPRWWNTGGRLLIRRKERKMESFMVGSKGEGWRTKGIRWGTNHHNNPSITSLTTNEQVATWTGAHVREINRVGKRSISITGAAAITSQRKAGHCSCRYQC